MLKQIEARALQIAAELDRKHGPYRAEVVPMATPHWHIVRTVSGQENKAVEYLADRGLGVFLPRFVSGSRLVLPHEVVDLSNKLLFPGRMFVFVWDVLAHWRRIMSCPGVAGIMVNGSEVPIVVPDSEIDRIQIMQFILAVARTKRRKRYASSDDRIVLSTASYWHVDGNERNHVLDKLLGT